MSKPLMYILKPLIYLLLPLCLGAQGLKINCGSTAPAGEWQADAYYSGGVAWSPPAPTPNVPAQYQTLRYGNFTYNLPAPQGSYNLHLYFIENSTAISGPGQRKFDVLLNGSPALTAYDIAATVGLMTTVEVIKPAVSSGSGVTVKFVTQLRNAVVSAIWLEPVDVQPAPTGQVNYSCVGGLGDGFSPLLTNGVFTSETKYRYSQVTCFNDSGVPLRVTQIRCFADDAAGTSTLDVLNGAGASLLSSPVTCGPTWPTGSQSSVITIAPEDWVQFIFTPDGNTTQSTWLVTMKR